MPRFAVKLPEEFVNSIMELVGAPENPFGDKNFIIIEPINLEECIEFNVKILSEDQTFEAVKNDHEIEIVQF